MVEVTFSGGPFDGQTREYLQDPRVVACASEAEAVSMHGLYRTRHGADGLDAVRQPIKQGGQS